MENATGHQQALNAKQPFLPTGVEGFDKVLGGGLPAHGLYLIQGLAGSGKTTMACQIGFHHARAGTKVLVLTLMAESHGKLISHLRNHAFYDEALVGNAAVFLSAYNSLAQGGLKSLLAFITATLAEHRPALIIVDGFRSVHEASRSGKDLAEFMHALNGLISTLGCTALLLSPVEGISPGAENTLVDGIIELSQFARGMRLVRELQVHKLRGSRHMLGKHLFEIGEDGIVIYPRFEAVAAQAQCVPEASTQRMGFGIAGWDRVTEGGVAVGSSTNLLGNPGIGKTLMGLHFIHQGLRENQRCLMLGFYESPPRILEKARKVGMDLARPMQEGAFDIMWQLPLEILIDSLLDRLLENIDRRNVSRLFIDGLEGFRDILMHEERALSILVALINELRARNVTTVFTQELPYFKESFAASDSSASVLFENMMLLKYVEIDDVSHRRITVMKLRENGYDPAHHLMTISDAGISIEGTVAAFMQSRRGDT